MELYALRQVLEVHAASQIPLPVPQARLAALVAVQREHDAAVADGDARRVFAATSAFIASFSACWTTRCWARPSRNTRAAPIPSASARWHRPAIANARARALGHDPRPARWRPRRLDGACRDHLLPSRDAYLASERARLGVVLSRRYARTKFTSRHGVVANPRDTYGYRCGLRLALTSMDEFRHADVPTGQHTSPPCPVT